MTVRYSPTEFELLGLLKTVDQLDTHQLVEAFYKGKDKPWHAEIVIRKAMNSLIAKVAANRELFLIVQTRQIGRKPDLFRISRKTKSKPLKKLAKI